MYRDFKDKFGPVFVAEMGADAVLKLLKKIDLDEISGNLKEEIAVTSGQKRKKSLKILDLGILKSHHSENTKFLKVDSSQPIKALVLSILARLRVMCSYPRVIRMGLWMETWLRFEPSQNLVKTALEDTSRKYFNVQPAKCWQD